MKTNHLKMAVAAACCISMAACSPQAENTKNVLTTVGNPYLPMWEHIPDGEPTPTSPENNGYISMGRTTRALPTTVGVNSWCGRLLSRT